MAFIIRAGERLDAPAEGIRRDRLLMPSDTGDGRVTIERWRIEAGRTLDVEIEAGTLAHTQMLGGRGTLGGVTETADIFTLLPAPYRDSFRADEDSDLLITRIPDARRFGHMKGDAEMAPKALDWTREPVLQSVHDDRKRIYVATRTLFQTSALKGEIIIYLPGATCPEHRHEGAEHYQYVVSGSGTAVLEGKEESLHTGDVLYNLENEWHWFRNDGHEDFVFVEYFVPGSAKTIWAPGADICEWMPTGTDIKGREPSRQIPRHSHGDQTVV